MVFYKKAGNWPMRAIGVALFASSFGAVALGQAEYDAIIESARSGSHQQALTELEAWSAVSPSIQKNQFGHHRYPALGGSRRAGISDGEKSRCFWP